MHTQLMKPFQTTPGTKVYDLVTLTVTFILKIANFWLCCRRRHSCFTHTRFSCEFELNISFSFFKKIILTVTFTKFIHVVKGYWPKCTCLTFYYRLDVIKHLHVFTLLIRFLILYLFACFVRTCIR